MVDWDPKAVRKTLGLSTGGFEGTRRPKGLIHTTEGFTLSSAFSAYRNNGYAPHVTIGPHPDGGQRTQRWQHYPFNSRATTLADRSGGVRTNRLWVYQVEVVGTCDDRWKGGSHGWLHVDNWPGWYREAVAELMSDWEGWFGIPRKSTVTFRPYPSSYGTSASQRLSPSAFTTYTGWLGHQHAPENTHGDPGDLNIDDLFARMGGGSTITAPKEDDDMKLSDQMDVPKWLIDRFPDDKGMADGKMSIQTALASGYAHARTARQEVADLDRYVHDAYTDLLENVKQTQTMVRRLEAIIAGQQPTDPPATTEETTYTIQSGDTLAAIAAAHGVSVVTIAERNNLSHPDRIFPGQIIIIPGRDT